MRGGKGMKGMNIMCDELCKSGMLFVLICSRTLVINKHLDDSLPL